MWFSSSSLQWYPTTFHLVHSGTKPISTPKHYLAIILINECSGLKSFIYSSIQDTAKDRIYRISRYLLWVNFLNLNNSLDKLNRTCRVINSSEWYTKQCSVWLTINNQVINSFLLMQRKSGKDEKCVSKNKVNTKIMKSFLNIIWYDIALS